MLPDPIDLIHQVAHALPLLIAVMMLAAFLEAALGLGALLPGESVVVIGAVAVTSGASGWVVPTAALVALAATVGDHIGLIAGRSAGPALRESAVVRRIGTGHWDRAMQGAARQRLTTLIILRQLPGVRTLVAATCGAARVSYPRFLLASMVGAALWSLIWVIGGAVVGEQVLEALGPWLPALVGIWISVLVSAALLRRARRDRS